MEGVICPECGGTKLARYGKTTAGLQKFLCRSLTRKTADGKPFECRRQFVAGSEHRIDPGRKRIALELLAQNVDPTKIKAAVPEISLRWLYRLRKQSR
jgi:transposase-like protein